MQRVPAAIGYVILAHIMILPISGFGQRSCRRRELGLSCEVFRSTISL